MDPSPQWDSMLQIFPALPSNNSKVGKLQKGERAPQLTPLNPLSLFYYHQLKLFKRIKSMHKAGRGNNVNFRLKCSKYRYMDPSQKVPKDSYRENLPLMTRIGKYLELERGFHEIILFSAQAISKGIDLSGGQQPVTEQRQVREAAIVLAASFEALKHVFWQKAVVQPQPNSIASSGIFPILHDFDKAWANFEKLAINNVISSSFDIVLLHGNEQGRSAASHGRLERIVQGQNTRIGAGKQSRLDMQQINLWTAWFSECLQGAIQEGLASREDVTSYEPWLMFALPRYALLRWFLIRPDYLDSMIGSQNITEMMRSDSFALELSALGTDEIAALEYVIFERGQESIIEDDEKVAKVYITLAALADPLQGTKELNTILSTVFAINQ